MIEGAASMGRKEEEVEEVKANEEQKQRDEEAKKNEGDEGKEEIKENGNKK